MTRNGGPQAAAQILATKIEPERTPWLRHHAASPSCAEHLSLWYSFTGDLSLHPRSWCVCAECFDHVLVA